MCSSDLAALEDADIGQFTALRINLQQHLVELVIYRSYGTVDIVFSWALSLGLFASGTTAQYDIARSAWRFATQIQALAELRKPYLTRQQAEWCTPIRALL